MKIHKTITTKRILRLVEDDNYAGLCTNCGAEADGCEPDARQYVCEKCGENAVYGAEELPSRIRMNKEQFREAIKAQCGFPSLLQSAEDERRRDLNEREKYEIEPDELRYSLRDDGRNPDGSGESYAERNA